MGPEQETVSEKLLRMFISTFKKDIKQAILSPGLYMLCKEVVKKLQYPSYSIPHKQELISRKTKGNRLRVAGQKDERRIGSLVSSNN